MSELLQTVDEQYLFELGRDDSHRVYVAVGQKGLAAGIIIGPGQVAEARASGGELRPGLW